jgi:hypothetical protein
MRIWLRSGHPSSLKAILAIHFRMVDTESEFISLRVTHYTKGFDDMHMDCFQRFL